MLKKAETNLETSHTILTRKKSIRVRLLVAVLVRDPIKARSLEQVREASSNRMKIQGFLDMLSSRCRMRLPVLRKVSLIE